MATAVLATLRIRAEPRRELDFAAGSTGPLERDHPGHARTRSGPGQIGRGYVDFVTGNQFSFPGEKGAGPELIVFRDCLHVLAEYGTSSLEETQIAAFQVGTMQKGVIYGLLFSLAQFHLGVQITPVSRPETGVIAPELWIKAFVRGTRTHRDMATSWQPWDDFARPVTELRREYGIEPRT